MNFHTLAACWTHRAQTQSNLQLLCAVDSLHLCRNIITCFSLCSVMHKAARLPKRWAAWHANIQQRQLVAVTCSGFNTITYCFLAVSCTRRLGYLNAGPHDVIRSIVLNECDGSILAVSFHATDTAFPNQLHCRSVPALTR
jgi:hypothetical protein